MKVELERSYVFSHESIPHIPEFLGTKTTGFMLNVQDDYLNPHLRIRTIGKSVDHIIIEQQLTRKSGEKRSGQRNEENCSIDRKTADVLITDSKLQVIKKRYSIVSKGPGFIVTLDVIEAPMKIAILEIESTNGKTPPTAKEVFGTGLRECPFAAWDLFKQKIGICGAPGSGKTETAKALSHLLNVHLHANSFHVPEYATSFIQKYNIYPNVMDQFMIWYSQRARESYATSKANIVVSDCPTFLSYVYMIFHNKNKINTQIRIHITKLYKRVLEDIDEYSHIIYLKPRNLVENNIRFQSIKEVQNISELIGAFLRWHNIPHTVAKCGDEQKILENLFFMNKTGKE